MWKKTVLMGLGLLGALLAAEGLNRLSGFVGAMGGADAGFYSVVLLVAVLDLGVLGAALLKRTWKRLKWVAFGLTVVGVLILLPAPGLPVVMQALFGLVLAAIGLAAVPGTRARGEGAPERAR